ncbi:cold shock domain-containing protein [Cytophagaceae bacterium ABcell3]|nr:cold shock domain-containing protein [Cytophagaceae bacterium ABcell3]
MKKGKVKFYNDSKGYGFIVEDDSQKDIFVHSSGLLSPINQNDLVTFSVEQGRKGMNAVNVELVS